MLVSVGASALACGDGEPGRRGTASHCLSPAKRAEALAFCPDGADLAARVDPMIGTAASGNTTPAVRVPHGMVKVGPNTHNSSGSVDAYQYDKDRIEGFTHDNLLGPGGSNNGYSQILVLPVVGTLTGTNPGSAFSHDSESAEVDRYAVTLDDYGVKVELTASHHAAIHRYTFPKTDEAKIFVDIGHSLAESIGGHLEMVGDRTIEGYGQYVVHPAVKLLVNDDAKTAEATTYFVAELSKPFHVLRHHRHQDHGRGHRQRGRTSSRRSIPRRLRRIYHRSGRRVGGTRRNFAHQRGTSAREPTGGARRQELRRRARRGAGEMELLASAVSRWRAAPSEQQTLLYTALYNTLTQPTDYTEVGGQVLQRHRRGRARWSPGRMAISTPTIGAPGTRSAPRGPSPPGRAGARGRRGRVVPAHLRRGRLAAQVHVECRRLLAGDDRQPRACPSSPTRWSKGCPASTRRWPGPPWKKAATAEDTDNMMPGLCGYMNLGTPPEYVENGYVPQECDTDQSRQHDPRIRVRRLGHGEDRRRRLARPAPKPRSMKRSEELSKPLGRERRLHAAQDRATAPG